MKKHLARLASLVLVIALLCTFVVPVSADDTITHWWDEYVQNPTDWKITNVDENGAVHSTNNYILFTSDLHRYTYLTKDLLQVANDLIQKTDGNTDETVGLLATGGDFANEKVLYNDNMSILNAALQTSPGTVITMTKGNHEASVTDDEFKTTTGMSRIGETCINEIENEDGTTTSAYHFYNFGALNGTQQFVEADVTALKTYLESVKSDGKPIFIVSHYPLHYYNDRRVSANAAEVVELLNNYPQVVFLWGHNHTESDPAYGYVRTAGDVIQTTASVDSTVEINFTYANLGALRDGTQGANGVLVRVNDDNTLSFRYINLNNSLSTTEYWVDAQKNTNYVRSTTLYDDPTKNIDGEEVTVNPNPDLNDITLANIKIDRPLVDKTPAQAASEYSDRFHSDDISWTDADGNAVTGTFDFDTAYTATVTLSPEQGYTDENGNWVPGYSFNSDAVVSINKVYVGPMPGSKNGEAEVTHNEDGTVTVSYAFDATIKQGDEKLDVATELVDGDEYVLAAIEDNYAASYMYNPADHGEESKADYTAAPADIVIRDKQLVSEVTDSMVFTAQKDASGYLLYSDASLEAEFPATGPQPEYANFLNMSTRGGDLGLEAAESITYSCYCDWNIDENGLPYIDMDGVKAYAAYNNGFTFVTDPAECDVRLYRVGTDDEGEVYSVNVNVETPVAGAAASKEADGAKGYVIEDVSWSADTFEAGSDYTVTITVAPADGYTIKDICVGRVNGNAADIKVDGGKAVITYTFSTAAASGKVLSVSGKAVDTITAGKTYVLVSNGRAMTDSNFGPYGSSVAVTEENGVLTSPITSDMLITMEGDADTGYYMKTAAGYIKGKTEGDKPDAWGLMYTDTATMTFNYVDGCMQLISTGDTKGGSSKTNYLYENDGHFNYFTLQPDSFTLYEVSAGFVDVSTTSYAYNAIEWAALNGITNGKDATHFVPGEKVTRGQAVTMLWRAAGSPAPTSAAQYSDVRAGSYCAEAVAWAVEQGITNGYADGTFRPNNYCTRAQLVTFLYRAAGEPDVEQTSTFEDVAANKYYASAVAWAVEQGITFGKDDTHFAPDEFCTRQHTVTFIYRYETK